MPLQKPAMLQEKRLFRAPKRSASGNQKKTMERTLSPLESLPAELLQKIFLFAESVALARSSPYLAAAVSSDHIIQQFCMRVLVPREQDEPIPINNEGSSTDTNAVAEASTTSTAGGQPERRALRLMRSSGWLLRRRTDPLTCSSGIFECRFMTWERFKMCVQLGLPTFHDSLFDHPYRLPVTFNSLAHLQKELIPKKLLRGPWTDDKAAFLYFLTWIGLRAPKSYENLANEGLRDAVSQQVPRAVAALVSPLVRARPTTALLCSAVIEHDCHLAIVRLLLVPWEKGAGPPPFLDFQDTELARWIETQKCRGNRKGSWLGARLKEARFGVLKHMSRTPGGISGADFAQYPENILRVSSDKDAVIPIPPARS